MVLLKLMEERIAAGQSTVSEAPERLTVDDISAAFGNVMVK